VNFSRGKISPGILALVLVANTVRRFSKYLMNFTRCHLVGFTLFKKNSVSV
jgi:hypothetical protein